MAIVLAVSIGVIATLLAPPSVRIAPTRYHGHRAHCLRLVRRCNVRASLMQGELSSIADVAPK
jgi:hypothetical protein